MKVKVGAKGRHIAVPEGWRVVTKGPALPGDRFISCPDYARWLEVTNEDFQDIDGNPIETTVNEFDCVIRKVKAGS